MVTNNLNPPGFAELIENFDEVSLPRRPVVFTPDWNKIDISLDFVGNEADMTNIPIIRDAIADYLRSDAFAAFVANDNLWVDIWFDFPCAEGDERDFVVFNSGSLYNFERWSVWRRPVSDTSDGLTKFFNSYSHRFLDRSWDVHYVANGIEISVRPHVRLSIVGTDDFNYEAEFADEVLALFERIKPDLPDLINGQFNIFLESVKWLDINDDFTITVHLDMFDDHLGNPRRFPVSSVTTIETLTFYKTADGKWAEIGGQ